ncbi:MAG: CO2 hydration protein, partial [Vulcanococcus sp.]
MPVISTELVVSNHSLEASDLSELLLSGTTLLSDTADHLLEVVGVLESYGEVLDAYSKNLIYQGEQQFLNPFPIFKYLDGDLSPAKIWRHLNHDRINFEYAEYC